MFEGKKTIAFFLSLACITNIFAQYNQWVWVGGGYTNSSVSTYVGKNIASPLNQPSARYEAVDWTDLSGNFWMYSSSLGVENNRGGNDLWKFDPVSSMWTFVKGDTGDVNNLNFDYGTVKVSAPGNQPPDKGLGAASWTDKQSNLWLFGGESYANSLGANNDMWKYDISTNNWTWMNGSSNPGSPGNFGVKGVFGPLNNPPAREETSCTWVDDEGYLWLFGGLGVKSDLWKFDPDPLRPTYNQWAWMSGSQSANASAVYGQKGVPDVNNTPGGRIAYASWKDSSNNLWFFGGAKQSGFLFSYFNDMWKYDINTNMWTWMSGLSTNAVAQAGVYGPLCEDSTIYIPSGRGETRSRWTDNCGNFWLYGGGSLNSAGNSDLWKYNPSTNKWTLIHGSSSGSAAVYGTKNVPAPTNTPGQKAGAVAWKGSDALWIFGGGSDNALWKFIPDKPTADFEFTIADCASTYTSTSVPNCNEIKSYFWNFGDPTSGALNYSTLANPTHTFSSSGALSIKLVVTSCTGGKDSISKTVTTGVDCSTNTLPSPSTINIPNIFSPNGDGKNELFQITATGIKTFSVKIYNRWGNIMFDSFDLANGWDGNITSGTKAPDGIYYYTITADGSDDKKYDLSGSFLLIR